MSTSRSEQPLPDPGQARTVDELAAQLRLLKIWAGDPSYQALTDRVNAAWQAARRPAGELAGKSTVADCFKIGRRRLNADLVIAVVWALHPEPAYLAQWRQALRVVSGEVWAAGQVRAQAGLPEDIAAFSGRRTEMDALRRALRAASGDAVVTCAIEGMAGVGKTQLAIHAGHILTREEHFDQVLYVDLRGFHPDVRQPPADPAAVLDSFLRLLDVPGQQIPHDLGARTAAYRTRLAGTRALVVLDNAADERQVEPLLPTVPGCLTLITSRRSLTALHRASRIFLDTFTHGEAVDFLARAAPDVPVGDDPEAWGRIAGRCGHLPLALGLVAGRMRATPGWTVTDHADRLDERHQSHRLDTEVEVALGCSYQHLPEGRRRVLRQLALNPGYDVDAYAATALTGLDLTSAREHLRQLSDDHLLRPGAPDRFVFHDLVRAYAVDRAGDEDSPASRRRALTRLLAYQLSTASTAVDVLYPSERQVRPRVDMSDTPTPPFCDGAAARAWLDAEHANLITLAGYAAVHDWPHHTTRLARILFRYLESGHLDDALTMHTHAWHAARRIDDPAAEATAISDLGIVNQRLGRYLQALAHHERAINLFRELDDHTGEARSLSHLGIACWHLGRYEQAAAHHTRALALFRELDHRHGQANAFGNLGHVYLQWGRYEQAGDQFRLALRTFRELGDRLGEAHALDDLGTTCGKLGRHQEAADHHQQAIALFRDVGDRIGDGHALSNLGVAYRQLGRHREAVDHHRQAIALFRDIGYQGGMASALNDLGDTLLANGLPEQASVEHSAALAHAEDLDDRYEMARAHDGLGRDHHATGDLDEARHHWKRALDQYSGLRLVEAEQLRRRLAALDDIEEAASAR